MRTIKVSTLAACLAANAASAAVQTNNGCDLPHVTYQGELQALLSRRAVEVIKLAARSPNVPMPALENFVAPEASFKTGGGDVVVPLQSGAAGAIELARSMKADTFRFFHWNYIPTPVDDSCGSQEINVEFTDTSRKIVYPVTFMFDKGRIVSAQGWSRSFEAGSIDAK